MNRRILLKTGAVGIGATLAGCATVFEPLPEPEPEPVPELELEPGRIVLEDIWFEDYSHPSEGRTGVAFLEITNASAGAEVEVVAYIHLFDGSKRLTRPLAVWSGLAFGETALARSPVPTAYSDFEKHTYADVEIIVYVGEPGAWEEVCAKTHRIEREYIRWVED